MHYLRSIFSVSLLTIIGGCVSTPVKFEQRDQTGTYTGRWQGVVELTEEEKYQHYQTVRFTCSEYRSSIALTVSDGMASGSVGRGRGALSFETPISTEGKFFAKIASANKFRETGSANNLGYNKVHFLLKGKLSAASGTGQGTLMHARVGTEQGCTGNFELSKQ